MHGIKIKKYQKRKDKFMSKLNCKLRWSTCIIVPALICLGSSVLRGVDTKIAEKLQSKYSISAKEAKTPPKIDGNLDESEWKNAGKAKDFVAFTGDKKANEDSEAFVMYDKDYLYLAMICHTKNPEKIKTHENVFKGDCVEIFLDPGCTECNYAHVAVNPKSKAFLALGTGGIKHNIKSASKILDDRWQVEIAVPFSDLKFPSNSTKDLDLSIWGMNFCRGNLELKEWTCWSPTLIGFHNPAKFGIVSGISNDFTKFAKSDNDENLSGKKVRIKTDRLFYDDQENIILTIRLSPSEKSLKGAHINLSVKDAKGAELIVKKSDKTMLEEKMPIKISELPEGLICLIQRRRAVRQSKSHCSENTQGIAA
jgi:hypothetical protein